MMTDTTRIHRKPPITPIAMLWIALVLPTRAQEALYGTWRSVGGPEQWYQFYDNGTDSTSGFVAYSATHRHSPAEAGSVVSQDATHVALVRPLAGSQRILAYAIQGDRLTLTADGEAPAEFQRVQGVRPADAILGVWTNDETELIRVFIWQQAIMTRPGVPLGSSAFINNLNPTYGEPYHFKGESTLRTTTGTELGGRTYHVALFGRHLLLVQNIGVAALESYESLVSAAAVPLYTAWWHENAESHTLTCLKANLINEISLATAARSDYEMAGHLTWDSATFRTPDDAHLLVEREADTAQHPLPAGTYTFAFPHPGTLVLTFPDGTSTLFYSRIASPTPVVTTHSFKVSAKAAWQDTGIELNPGDIVTIDATGEIVVTPSPLAFLKSRATPEGLPAYPTVGGTVGASLVYTLTADSLVGRVAPDGEPFAVGTHCALTSPLLHPGHLFLAPNCTSFKHNEGEWTATISVTH